jgi:hypothetical protein
LAFRNSGSRLADVSSVARYLARIPLLPGAIALLYDDTVEPRTLIALLGISLAAWAALCARVGLAFRYAANPGTVDALAINGLTLSLGAWRFFLRSSWCWRSSAPSGSRRLKTWDGSACCLQ